MYINTRDISSMERAICQVLNINKKQLDDLFENCYNSFQKCHHIFILDDQYDYFREFVEKYQRVEIDQILFVHLSRRLDDNNTGYNFVDVLTKETSLARFFNKYDITFKYDRYLRVYKNDNEIILENDELKYPIKYLKDRFGYFYHNFGFSGFMFNDVITNSEFYEVASGGPDFFGYLFSILDDNRLIDDFYRNSNYYQFEYVVPIEKIYFENYEELSTLEKQQHIIIKVLQRLYNYKYDLEMNEIDNDVIVVKDNQNLSENYLVKKILL